MKSRKKLLLLLKKSVARSKKNSYAVSKKLVVLPRKTSAEPAVGAPAPDAGV